MTKLSGFRIDFGGAAKIFDIVPDLACFGKIIGGGFPVGAYGGKEKIMQMVSPVGGVYQAGTLSGNPIAMHTGMKNIQILKEDRENYHIVKNHAKTLEEAFNENIKKTSINATVVRYEGLLTLFFGGNGQFKNYDDVSKCDTNMYGKYFRAMVDMGVMCPPAQFEVIFISSSHTDEDIEKTIFANKKSLESIRE